MMARKAVEVSKNSIYLKPKGSPLKRRFCKVKSYQGECDTLENIKEPKTEGDAADFLAPAEFL